MKILFASLLTLPGIFLFFSFPVESNFILTKQEITHNREQDTTKKPVFIPEKVTLAPFRVLIISDTATTAADIGWLLHKNYGELFAFISRQNLHAGKVMALYYSSHEPFIFDAAVEVERFPPD